MTDQSYGPCTICRLPAVVAIRSGGAPRGLRYVSVHLCEVCAAAARDALDVYLGRTPRRSVVVSRGVDGVYRGVDTGGCA